LLASLLLLLVRVDPGTFAVLLVSLRLLTVAGVPSVLTTLLLLASLLLLLVRVDPGTPAIMLVLLRLLTVAASLLLLTLLLLLASLLLLLVRDAPDMFNGTGLLSIANCWLLTPLLLLAFPADVVCP
jgi:hypothetical protein